MPNAECGINEVPLWENREPSAADAWHAVGSPGGYEWWYFDAEDAAGGIRVVAILLDGFVFHPGYLRAYYRYRRRPTRHRPPLAREYPCAYFVVYESGKLAHQFMTQYPAGSLLAAKDRPEVEIGPNRFWRENGALRLRLAGTPWVLTGMGPKLLSGQSLEGDFTFAPRSAEMPAERTFLSQAMTGEQHRWVIANPLCDVQGSIRHSGSGVSPLDCEARSRDGSATLNQIEFTGRGYHDHNYGTGPLGPGLARWIWGRVLLGDRVATFHYARPRDRRLGDEVHLIEADAAGIRDLPVARVTADWSQKTRLWLAYPAELRFDDILCLSNPRVIDSAPFYMRLVYEAAFKGQRGSALCEVAYPHRLLWPVLGRMIEMSIERRALTPLTMPTRGGTE
ncbi:MAG: hypothetical protein ACHRHE_21700 [Tepidisphaerales bacterium]